MMGNDVERILAGINSVKDAAMSSIKSLSSATAYRLISEENHAGLGTGPCSPKEVSVPAGASSFASPVINAMSSFNSDYGKMLQLSSGLYTDISTFNNNYGSPWTELVKLNESIEALKSFSAAHAPLEWVGEKAGLLGLINMVLSASIDAKWALTYYHDYIQRGYDNKFNGNKPSITFTSGINKESIGNVDQQFNENVHIPEQSIDPF